MNTRDIANALRRAKYKHGSDIDRIMDHVDSELKAYGVESIRSETHGYRRRWGETVALYVNVGETYSATLIFDTLAERFAIESMGDFVERKERRRPCRYGFKAA